MQKIPMIGEITWWQSKENMVLIIVTNHLGNVFKQSKMLMCYDFQLEESQVFSKFGESFN